MKEKSDWRMGSSFLNHQESNTSMEASPLLRLGTRSSDLYEAMTDVSFISLEDVRIFDDFVNGYPYDEEEEASDDTRQTSPSTVSDIDFPNNALTVVQIEDEQYDGNHNNFNDDRSNRFPQFSPSMPTSSSDAQGYSNLGFCLDIVHDSSAPDVDFVHSFNVAKNAIQRSSRRRHGQVPSPKLRPSSGPQRDLHIPNENRRPWRTGSNSRPRQCTGSKRSEESKVQEKDGSKKSSGSWLVRRGGRKAVPDETCQVDERIERPTRHYSDSEKDLRLKPRTRSRRRKHRKSEVKSTWLDVPDLPQFESSFLGRPVIVATGALLLEG